MDNNFDRCRLPDPYPIVSPQPPNPDAARMLLGAYASPRSETTCIMQYVYNSQIAPLQEQQAIADLFYCVSVVEMHHMNMIAGLIIDYGGDPGFLYYPTPDRTEWWTGANVTYNKDPATMLRDSIRHEEELIEYYRRTALSLSDPSARALLQRISADEERHIALFTEALNTLL